MNDSAFEAIRHLPREELESFACRAALEIRRARTEDGAGNVFAGLMIGFLLGALVGASGLFLGLGLG